MPEEAKGAKDGPNDETKQGNEEESLEFPVRLTMDKRIELAIFGVIVLFGVFLIREASKIRAGLIPDPITAKGMPYLTGIFLIMSGITLGVMRLLTWSALPGNLVPGEGHEDEEGHPSSWIRVFTIVVTTWISVMLLKPLGYLLATPFFMIIAVWSMGVRDWKKLIGFPVLYTLVTWFIFSQPLQFVLPLGFLTPFFRSLGLTP